MCSVSVGFKELVQHVCGVSDGLKGLVQYVCGVSEEFKERYLDKLVTALPASTWKVQVVILQALHKFVDRLVISHCSCPFSASLTFSYFFSFFF